MSRLEIEIEFVSEEIETFGENVDAIAKYLEEALTNLGSYAETANLDDLNNLRRAFNKAGRGDLARQASRWIQRLRESHEGNVRAQEHVKYTKRKLVSKVVNLAERRAIKDGDHSSTKSRKEIRKEARSLISEATDIPQTDLDSFRRSQSSVIPTPHELNRLIKACGGASSGDNEVSRLRSAVASRTDSKEISAEHLERIAKDVGIPPDPPSGRRK